MSPPTPSSERGRDESEFRPARLTLARMRRQCTQAELARSIGMTPITINRYEKGKECPSTETLGRISARLGFPREFFTDGSPIPEIEPEAISFRAYSKVKARLRDNATAVSILAIQLSKWLSESFELPPLDVPDLSEAAGHDPESAAQLLRDEWALGHGPIANMVHLLESHGVRVFSLTEDAADVDAFCFWHREDGALDNAYIVLNLLKSAERGRTDAAHELAHLVLHRRVNFVSDKIVERAADRFAAAFLVPRDSLLAQLPPTITLETVFALKKHWSVSAMSMVRRLKDVDRISAWVYRDMCIDLTKRGYRSGEVDGGPRETSSVLKDALAELQNDGVTLSDMAKSLRVSVSDIVPLLFSGAERGRLRVINGGLSKR